MTSTSYMQMLIPKAVVICRKAPSDLGGEIERYECSSLQVTCHRKTEGVFMLQSGLDFATS